VTSVAACTSHLIPSQISQDDEGFEMPNGRDSLDFDALADNDDDEEAGGNGKIPAYDPPDRDRKSHGGNNGYLSAAAANANNEDPLPAPAPQRPQQRRELDGEGETMFAVGEDDEDDDDDRDGDGIKGFSDSEDEGLVHGGRGRGGR